jgi:hypothetical protein
MKLLFLISFVTLWAHSTDAQTIDTVAIKQELAAIYQRDQKTRKNADSIAYISFIDSTNLVRIEAMIDKYGWPGIDFVGQAGNNTAFLVIQHADLATQEKYLPMLTRSVAEGRSSPADLAYLQDRVLMRQGKKQIYGSQVIPTNFGTMEFHPIEDEENVNLRRAKVGLPPIEEYARYFGIELRPQKQKKQ